VAAAADDDEGAGLAPREDEDDWGIFPFSEWWDGFWGGRWLDWEWVCSEFGLGRYRQKEQHTVIITAALTRSGNNYCCNSRETNSRESKTLDFSLGLQVQHRVLT